MKDEATLAVPRHQCLNDEREAITHKFQVGDFDGYLTVGYYEDGRIGELFIVSSKQGSTIRGMLNAFSIAVSMGLQRGILLDDFIEKFKHMRFEPQGFTKNKDISYGQSVIDYVFRWLELKQIDATAKHTEEQSPDITDQDKDKKEDQGDGLPGDCDEESCTCDSGDREASSASGSSAGSELHISCKSS